jgi:hypothetical protein
MFIIPFTIHVIIINTPTPKIIPDYTANIGESKIHIPPNTNSTITANRIDINGLLLFKKSFSLFINHY